MAGTRRALLYEKMRHHKRPDRAQLASLGSTPRRVRDVSPRWSSEVLWDKGEGGRGAGSLGSSGVHEAGIGGETREQNELRTNLKA